MTPQKRVGITSAGVKFRLSIYSFQ